MTIMKQKLLLLLLLNLSLPICFGQINTRQIPKSFELKNIESPIPIVFKVNINELIKNAKNADSSLLVAVPILIKKNYLDLATKVYSDKECNIYQLILESQEATSLGIYFSSFYLPKGYKLYAFNKDRTDLIGAFTSRNNSKSQKFTISPLVGNQLVLELYEPVNRDKTDILTMEISKLAHYFKENHQLVSSRKLRPNSTTIDSVNCYLDVACLNNFGQERAIFLWTYEDTSDELFYVCTGAMLNQDVPVNDLRPIAYSADHCGENADLTTSLFRFHFQNSICNLTSMSPNYSMVGATFLASKSLSDMFLMEFEERPPSDFNLIYLGWDRRDRNSFPSGVKGIHHPEGGKKALSLGTFAANTNPYFWRVEWDVNLAPTSQGSSGSPLFSYIGSNRVIGSLSYGTAQCDNLDGIDRYGKLRAHWDDPFGADKRLRDWLDPNNNDKDFIDTREPCYNDVNISASVLSPGLEYQSNNFIPINAGNTITISNSFVSNNSYYQFNAGNSITILPGFLTGVNSIFETNIKGCFNP
jgi:hypothetical protein